MKEAGSRKWRGAIALAMGLAAFGAQARTYLADVQALEAKGATTCARVADGTVRCWGGVRAGFGEPGQTHAVPISVLPPGLPFDRVAIGAGGLCYMKDGMAPACNHTSYILYGLGEYTAGVAALAVGLDHACAITLSGGVECTGQGGRGQLGDGSTNIQFPTAPVAVTGLASGVTTLAAGHDHTCAITAAGGVKCWGSNAQFFLSAIPKGQLGHGQPDILSAVPVDVVGLSSGVTALASGPWGSCAVKAGEGVFCWGAGQLEPRKVEGLGPDTVAVGVGGGTGARISVSLPPSVYQWACAMSSGGAVRCWQGGSAPELVPGLESGATALAVGDLHACARVAGGEVRCWGGGAGGQLGDGRTVSSSTPVAVVATAELRVTKRGTGSGEVTSSTPGIACGSACAAEYAPGATTTLTAMPAPGSVFVRWEGGCSGRGACDFPATADADVGALFTPPAGIPRLGNVSTRARAGTGNDSMIGGFIIGGTQPKSVVVRGVGPSLGAQGVGGALADPQLQLFAGSALVGYNDDWQQASNATALQASGFAPNHPSEPALLVTLAPGAYTAIVSGVGGRTGLGLVEVFEADLPDVPLLNLSTRGMVSTGDDVMIGGFVIQGEAPRTVVVRARGPSLTAAGVTGALENPVLQLMSGQSIVATNDNWQAAANASELSSSGFAPSDSREAAILITLNPGAYTAIVTGAGGTTGVAIIEVFAQ